MRTSVISIAFVVVMLSQVFGCGAMRAESHERLPLIRMVNVSLEPGRGSYEDLLADSEGALLYETNKSWSIDDQRLHFQFGCEVAWEIRGGKKVEMYRDPVYAGTTPKFWKPQ